MKRIVVVRRVLYRHHVAYLSHPMYMYAGFMWDGCWCRPFSHHLCDEARGACRTCLAGPLPLWSPRRRFCCINERMGGLRVGDAAANHRYQRDTACVFMAGESTVGMLRPGASGSPRKLTVPSCVSRSRLVGFRHAARRVRHVRGWRGGTTHTARHRTSERGTRVITRRRCGFRVRKRRRGEARGSRGTYPMVFRLVCCC